NCRQQAGQTSHLRPVGLRLVGRHRRHLLVAAGGGDTGSWSFGISQCRLEWSSRMLPHCGLRVRAPPPVGSPPPLYAHGFRVVLAVSRDLPSAPLSRGIGTFSGGGGDPNRLL